MMVFLGKIDQDHKIMLRW